VRATASSRSYWAVFDYAAGVVSCGEVFRNLVSRSRVGNVWLVGDAESCRPMLALLPRDLQVAASRRGLEGRIVEGVVDGVDRGARRDNLVNSIQHSRFQHDLGSRQLPSNCSMVRGPMIADVMAGWVSTKAIAFWMSVMPVSSASWASSSTASSLRWLAGWEVEAFGQPAGGGGGLLPAVLAPAARQPSAG